MYTLMSIGSGFFREKKRSLKPVARINRTRCKRDSVQSTAESNTVRHHGLNIN